MTSAEHLNYAKRYLAKAEEYLASAEDNVDLERATPAAGDAIHAGISAKDAIVTVLTGTTSKAKNHAQAARELRTALGARSESASAEKALRELIAAKGDVEYSTMLITLAKADPLVRRARALVDLARRVVRQTNRLDRGIITTRTRCARGDGLDRRRRLGPGRRQGQRPPRPQHPNPCRPDRHRDRRSVTAECGISLALTAQSQGNPALGQGLDHLSRR